MNNTRVLVIEDDPALLRGLETNLTAEGYNLLKSSSGEDGLQQAITHSPDLVILDVTLPGKNGFDVCREMRTRGIDAPIVMLAARTEEIDCVLALEIGADDYVTKPFGMRELLARVRARLRRRVQCERAVSICNGLKVDFERCRAERNGNSIELTHKEASILRILMERRGEVVPRESVLERVWGRDINVTARTVDNHVLRLRQKIEPDPANPSYILSAYGEGYKFCARTYS